MKAWMRILTVTFTSRNLKKKMVFGENYLKDNHDLNINVSIHKYMSPLKDSATIRIDNLTYDKIVTLISGNFYDVEIKAGYRESGAKTVFKGGVLYISNALNADKTSTAIIMCASDLVARYGQNRINLTLNSGINLYSALNFVCKMAKIPNSTVSTQFKKKFIKEVTNINTTAASYFDILTSRDSSFISNSDSSDQSIFTIYDAMKSDARIIQIDNKAVNLVGGYPQLSKDGLYITLTPTFTFMCGDVIKIDNSLIDISATSNNTNQMTKGYYLDKEGLYTIFEITYELQNRAPNFTVRLKCKSRNLITKFIGGK